MTRSTKAKPIHIGADEHDYLTKYVADRTVLAGECIEWTGSIQKNGRAVASLPSREGRTSRRVYAYRLAWTLRNGTIPDGMHLCHKCDNPKCVKVEHLFLGTHVDNMADMIAKGRCSTPVYSADLMKEVIAEWRSGKWSSRAKLARHFGVSHPSVCKWVADAPMLVHPDVAAYRDELPDASPAKSDTALYGEAHAQSKLTDAQIAEICARYSQPGGPKTRSNAKALAVEFGVSSHCIGTIAHGVGRRQRTSVPVPDHVCREQVPA